MTSHHCPSHPCPLCFPNYQYPPNYPNYGYGTVAQPRGCICPPGSEKTCQGFGCPRKPMIATSATEAGQ